MKATLVFAAKPPRATGKEPPDALAALLLPARARRRHSPPGAAHRSRSSLLLGLFGARVAADLPVEEPEGVRHAVADVGQAQHHEGHPGDGVEDGDHLPPVGLGRDVSVACGRRRARSEGVS